jgi:hypothetical protein
MLGDIDKYFATSSADPHSISAKQSKAKQSKAKKE